MSGYNNRGSSYYSGGSGWNPKESGYRNSGYRDSTQDNYFSGQSKSSVQRTSYYDELTKVQRNEREQYRDGTSSGWNKPNNWEQSRDRTYHAYEEPFRFGKPSLKSNPIINEQPMRHPVAATAAASGQVYLEISPDHDPTYITVPVGKEVTPIGHQPYIVQADQPIDKIVPIEPVQTKPIDPQPVMGNQWDHGLWQCFKDIPTCLCGTFCALCLTCQVAKRIDFGVGMCFVTGIFCPCLLIGCLRGETRRKYNIQGNANDDCLCGICCGSCSLCQMAHETKQHK